MSHALEMQDLGAYFSISRLSFFQAQVFASPVARRQSAPGPAAP